MSSAEPTTTAPAATTVVKGDWYFEKETELWEGQRFGLKVLRRLEDVHSKYQHIEVFDTVSYGRMLVLDGVIQLTQRDEYCYSEQMAHLPLFAHANPERVGGELCGASRADLLFFAFVCSLLPSLTELLSPA
jgi:spermidine synthase